MNKAGCHWTPRRTGRQPVFPPFLSPASHSRNLRKQSASEGRVLEWHFCSEALVHSERRHIDSGPSPVSVGCCLASQHYKREDSEKSGRVPSRLFGHKKARPLR